jgi:signal transduction histidine kinase
MDAARYFSSLTTARTSMTSATWLALAISILFSALFALHSPLLDLKNTAPLDQLNGHWDLCIPTGPVTANCIWRKATVPGALPAGALEAFQGWAIYRKHFFTPSYCVNNASECAFLFAEIGDAAELTLNGQSVGKHGNLPPHALYAKHYPFHVPLHTNSLTHGDTPNILQIVTYSLKKVQAGVRAPPIGLYKASDASKLTRALTVVNVVIPVMTFVALFVVAWLALAIVGTELVREDSFLAFVRFCLASACFCLSISELPREYLPIGLAGYLHFSLRILHDWTFFELVTKHFQIPTRLVSAARKSYALFVIAFFLQYAAYSFRAYAEPSFEGNGFDVGFLTLRFALPNLLLPHILGLYCALKTRTTSDGKALSFLFFLTLLFQIHDSAIFHGYGSGIYYVKWYPLLIAIVFGAFILRRVREIRSRANAQAAIGRIVAQVAHDIRSPVSALSVLESECDALPGHSRELLRGATSRIREISSNLISLYSQSQLTVPVATRHSVHRLGELLRVIVEEKLIQLKNEDFRITFELTPTNHNLQSRIDPIEFKRIASNLIDNGIEAQHRSGAVEVYLKPRGVDLVEVQICDRGPGMESTILSNIGNAPIRSGKPGGSGLGLFHAVQMVSQWSGELSIQTSPGIGTSISIVLPRAST